MHRVWDLSECPSALLGRIRSGGGIVDVGRLLSCRGPLGASCKARALRSSPLCESAECIIARGHSSVVRPPRKWARGIPVQWFAKIPASALTAGHGCDDVT
jgi:hypothetical protein